MSEKKYDLSGIGRSRVNFGCTEVSCTQVTVCFEPRLVRWGTKDFVKIVRELRNLILFASGGCVSMLAYSAEAPQIMIEQLKNGVIMLSVNTQTTKFQSGYVRKTCEMLSDYFAKHAKK